MSLRSSCYPLVVNKPHPHSCCGASLQRQCLYFILFSDVIMLLRNKFIYIILCAEIGFIIIFFKVTVILMTNRKTKIILKGFIHLKML